jgi:GntR family transcriptional regulator/MocR family aminotransferase
MTSLGELKRTGGSHLNIYTKSSWGETFMPTSPALPFWSIALDRNSPVSLQEQIVRYFREAVVSHRLKPGSRVPSSRTFSTDHGVARITVVQAYEQLVAEGYLVPRAGAGMFVADSAPELYLRAASAEPFIRAVTPTSTRVVSQRRLPSPPMAPFDVLPLAIGAPDVDYFPWAHWTTISTRVQQERPTELLVYGDARGLAELREAIAEYLGASRGIACMPEQILVVSGSQQGLDLTARALARPGEAAWFEEPGYPRGRLAFEAAGLGIVPIPVDDQGINVTIGTQIAPDARLALVSPTHQYPMGVTMSLKRRLALLQWAECANSWILEDDYDGEYRYSGRPLAPLHVLDRGSRVLYLGTFSKILAPSLRVGYLILPPDLVDRFAALKSASDHHTSGLIQRTLARFIREGRLSSHLKRMRVVYARRRATLIAALEQEAAGLLTMNLVPEAGLHLVAKLIVDVDDVAASRRALEYRVRATALSSFYAQDKRERGFVLGFGGTREGDMIQAVRLLVRAIGAK